MFVRIAIDRPEVSKISQFDAEKFILEPSQDIFDKLRKDELILLANHLNLEVKKAMKKTGQLGYYS